MKIKLLTVTTMAGAGLLLGGCNLNLPKLPEINKETSGSCSGSADQKLICYDKLNRDLTERECEDLRNALRDSSSVEKSYYKGASMIRTWCDSKYGGIDIDIEAIMEKNK